jgi:hypothetical protein
MGIVLSYLMNVDEFHFHFDENHWNLNDVLNDYEMQLLAINDQNDVDVDHLMMDEIKKVGVVAMNEENTYNNLVLFVSIFELFSIRTI